MGKHTPPLAEHRQGGYGITDHGRDFYRAQHTLHVTAYPDVTAPHPDGAAAEPWPARADTLLSTHANTYQALVDAWRTAQAMQSAAEQEAAAAPPAPAAALPTAVAAQIVARHQIWRDTARQRATLAAEHAADIQGRAERAARAYAAAALTVFNAAVTRADPLAGLQPPTADEAPDPPELSVPSETGIHAIDTEAKKRHATAEGAPLKRRGPAPKRRTSRSPQRHQTPTPGADAAALADYLHSHTAGGALQRRLRP